MRLLSFKRFELDLPALLAALEETGFADGNIVADFVIQEETTTAREMLSNRITEVVFIELVNPDLMTCKGILKVLDKTKNEYLVGFTAIHKSQFINVCFKVTLDVENGFYSVRTEVKMALTTEPTERLNMSVTKFMILQSFFRSCKNDVSVPFNDDDGTFGVDIINVAGKTVTYPLHYPYLQRMFLITETGEDSYTVNIDRGIRMLKYIARSNEILSDIMLAEINDI